MGPRPAARREGCAARAAFAAPRFPCGGALRRHPDAERPRRGAGRAGWTGDPAFNSLWTLLHVPCVTVPVGTGPKGLPLGVQIVTGFGRDREALAWAEWVRQAAG